MEAHVGIDRVVIHADEKARDAAERGRDGEHRAVDPVHVDAALLRGIAIERGCPHRPAELGKAQEQIQRERADEADAGDQDIERADRAAADLDAPLRELQRHAARIGREQKLKDLIEHQPDADGGEQRRDARRALQWAQADALDRHAEQPAAEHDRKQGQGQRRSQIGDAQPTDIGADHVDRAMREIDEMRDAVDQRQPDREQRVDIADDQTIDGVVEPGAERGGHGIARHCAGLSSRPTPALSRGRAGTHVSIQLIPFRRLMDAARG